MTIKHQFPFFHIAITKIANNYNQKLLLLTLAVALSGVA